MNWVKGLACVTLASTCLLGGVGARAQMKEVQFYSSLTIAGQNALVQQIEKAFPGLKVVWISASGVDLYQRFVSERMAGKGKIDLFHSSYTPSSYHLAEQGWVAPGVADGGEADRFPEAFKDRRAHWVALRVSSLQVIYNPKQVKPEEVPKSWQEFTGPKWKDRLALVDPLKSAGVWDFFYGSKEFGEQYITGLLKNRPLIQGAMGSATERVSAGERDAAFVFDYIALGQMRKGASIKIAAMREGVPVVPGPLAMIQGGPNPEIARKVFDFMLSQAGQRIMSQDVMTYSGRPDVPPPSGLPPLDQVRSISSDWGKVYREQDKYRTFITEQTRQR